VFRNARWIDPALALLLTAASQAEIWSTHQHDLAGRHASAAATTLVITGLVAVRRRFPAVCAPVAIADLIVQQTAIGDVQGASAFSVLALVILMYSLGAYAPTRRAQIVGTGCAVAFIAMAIAKSKGAGDITFVGVVLFAPWLAGMVIHARHRRERQLEEEVRVSEERARTAVEDERARIARELHDVVAHAMSVIVVQAGAERHVLPAEQASTRAVLEAIERTGRQALGEMRRLLGMMRARDEELALAPQPSLAYLPELCEQVRAAGLPVELEVEGQEAPLPPGVDVSAYRIVQEALTNALKHAGPASARVTVRYRADGIEVEVVDDGRGAAGNGSGHGLVGMRERVAVYGGELRTGNQPSGGYAVRVRLPLDERAP
jgi:signal transduction histidine kinase